MGIRGWRIGRTLTIPAPMAAERKGAHTTSAADRSRQAKRSLWRTGAAPTALRVAGAFAIAGVMAIIALALAGGTDDRPVPWSSLDTDDVHALAFAPDDEQHLYFGHHDGLLESRDGGRSWQPTSLTGADAMNVKVSGERIQIAGHDLYVESRDGGATWQQVPNDLPSLDLHALAVDPADPDHAWTFAVGFGLFETTDAGRHWEQRQPGNWANLTAYRAADRTTLIAVGPDGLVRSSDGGATWEPLAYPGAPLGAIAAARDAAVLYAATTAGLRRSTDQGQTWTDTGFVDMALAVAVAPDDPMDVALVDEATRFFRSTDGATTWPAP